METLKRETEVTDEQLASVEETDLPKSSSHFDNTVEIQTDIIEDKARTAMNRRQAGINDSSVKQTNQEAGSRLTSAMVTGGDISPTQDNYSNLCNYITKLMIHARHFLCQAIIICCGSEKQMITWWRKNNNL